MQIDDDLQAMVLRPTDRLLEIGKLTLDVWLTGGNVERPEPNRDADVIEARRSDVGEVLLSDKCIPVLLECRLSFRFILVLSKRVLVDDGGVASTLEDAWCNPRLT
jgi:hypothetical protein